MSERKKQEERKTTKQRKEETDKVGEKKGEQGNTE